jgi:hypothetical protein
MSNKQSGFKNSKGNIVKILSKKKDESDEMFFKRMNEQGYGDGDLEKVPHHWNSDASRLHPGASPDDCPYCKDKAKPSDDSESKSQATDAGASKDNSEDSEPQGQLPKDEAIKEAYDADEAGDAAESRYLDKKYKIKDGKAVPRKGK